MNKQKIYRSHYVYLEGVFDLFHLRWTDSSWPKPNPNQDLGHYDSLDVSVSEKNVTSLLDTCLHTATQILMVNFIACIFAKSYHQPILINNFEKSTSITRHVGVAKLFVFSKFWKKKTLGTMFFSVSSDCLPGSTERPHYILDFLRFRQQTFLI